MRDNSVTTGARKGQSIHNGPSFGRLLHSQASALPGFNSSLFYRGGGGKSDHFWQDPKNLWNLEGLPPPRPHPRKNRPGSTIRTQQAELPSWPCTPSEAPWGNSTPWIFRFQGLKWTQHPKPIGSTGYGGLGFTRNRTKPDSRTTY